MAKLSALKICHEVKKSNFCPSVFDVENLSYCTKPTLEIVSACSYCYYGGKGVSDLIAIGPSFYVMKY